MHSVGRAIAVLGLVACGPKPTETVPEQPPAEPVVEQVDTAVSGLYHVQRDARRCAAPACGGWWLLDVNRPTTACPTGEDERCYAMPGTQLPDGALVQATLKGGPMGELSVERAWGPVGEGAKSEVYQLGDNGVRCVRAPCESISAAVVGGEGVPVSDVDTTAVGKVDPEALGEAIVSGTLFAAGSIEQRDETRVFVATELWLPVAK
ncbi:MAG: hypothetical protein EP330_27685 [Deltaproteobacteria bacterium]|nr:MAG: hypothetical protein EP330_27685 [Deltaproteobacteria bacterium]